MPQHKCITSGLLLYFKFKVAMEMDQFIERFKTLRVHCSVTFQKHRYTVKQSLVLNLPGATKHAS